MERLSAGDGDDLGLINKAAMIVERNSESSTEIMPTEEGGLSDEEQIDVGELIRKPVNKGGAASSKPRFMVEDEEVNDEESKKSQRDLEEEMKYKSILHLAKKNLMFELEYIQAVCEHLENGDFPQHNYRKKLSNSDNPLLDINNTMLDDSSIDDHSSMRSGITEKKEPTP